ncbi:putative branched-chain amino acid transport protein, partial [Alcanivorax xiamenensis]
MSPEGIFAGIAVAALASLASRALPFVALSRHRDQPLLEHLGRYLPAAIMTILVVYSLRDLRLFAHTDHGAILVWNNNGLPLLLSSLVVVLLHLIKRNVLLSILGGTAFHMLLVQYIVPGLAFPVETTATGDQYPRALEAAAPAIPEPPLALEPVHDLYATAL